MLWITYRFQCSSSQIFFLFSQIFKVSKTDNKWKYFRRRYSTVSQGVSCLETNLASRASWPSSSCVCPPYGLCRRRIWSSPLRNRTPPTASVTTGRTYESRQIDFESKVGAFSPTLSETRTREQGAHSTGSEVGVCGRGWICGLRANHGSPLRSDDQMLG